MSAKGKKAKPDAEEGGEAREAPAKEEAKAEPALGAEDAAKLHEAAAKAEEYLELAQRTKAEFVNYQERVRREKESLVKYAIEDFVREFLPALDAVRESVRAARSGGDAGQLVQGVQLIEREFLRILSKNGIVPIEAEGKPFDPAFHEAASVVERDDVEPNTIVGEIRRGWMLRDRVLRASLVAIARAPGKDGASCGDPAAAEP